MKRFFVTPVLLLLFSSCITIKPVEFRRTENFSVSGKGSAPGVSFGIVFHNPNSFGCTVSNLESEGSLNNRLFFTAGIDTKIRAAANSDIVFPVNAKLANMDLSQLLGTGLNLLLNNEAIPMQVKGKLKIRKFIFSKTYQFDYTERIDKAVLKKLF